MIVAGGDGTGKHARARVRAAYDLRTRAWSARSYLRDSNQYQQHAGLRDAPIPFLLAIRRVSGFALKGASPDPNPRAVAMDYG